jgi:2OG-Fe(II) oxygenase superfamily
VRRLHIVDRFSPHSAALRNEFEERFENPRQAGRGRFVWDLWNVPGQYTALRTPAWEYFSPKLYQSFHESLVWWGRRNLGCHDISPPWLSCYVNGCEQRLHSDVPHGHWAFVFSLTPWQSRIFSGGETLLLTEKTLDFFRDFSTTEGIEEPDLVESIPAKMNRLVVFDPKIPHGVRRIEGNLNPVQGRLVIHGWFVQPRPFIEGPLSSQRLQKHIEALSETVQEFMAQEIPLTGLLSLTFEVSLSGTASNVRVLSDTTRVPFEFEAFRKKLISQLKKEIGAFRFNPQKAKSRVTLPLVFERSSSRRT